jgi:pimeloyl-ACP methyl ester carboxylesterase
VLDETALVWYTVFMSVLEVQGNQIYYETVGTGVPVVMVHGFEVDHRILKHSVGKIRALREYEAVYFDLPGMGKTVMATQLYHAEEMYAVLQAVIDKLVGNRDYLVVGESYGGYLMRKLIKDTPEHILGAAFICPAVIPDCTKRNLPSPKLTHEHNPEAKKRFEESIAPGFRCANTAYLDTYKRSGYAFLEDVDNLREPFDKTALFVLGRQDQVVGYKDAYTILENYPRASFVVLDEAGHDAQIEKPGILEVCFGDFLERANVKK